MTKPARADNFFGSGFTGREKGVCDPELGNNFRELMSQFFSSNHNSTLIFVELTHVGFAWGSWLQWPAVFKLEGQVFKLEGVMFTMSLEGVCLPDFRHFSVLVVREAQKAKDSGILNRSSHALTILLLQKFS